MKIQLGTLRTVSILQPSHTCTVQHTHRVILVHHKHNTVYKISNSKQCSPSTTPSNLELHVYRRAALAAMSMTGLQAQRPKRPRYRPADLLFGWLTHYYCRGARGIIQTPQQRRHAGSASTPVQAFPSRSLPREAHEVQNTRAANPAPAPDNSFSPQSLLLLPTRVYIYINSPVSVRAAGSNLLQSEYTVFLQPQHRRTLWLSLAVDDLRSFSAVSKQRSPS